MSTYTMSDYVIGRIETNNEILSGLVNREESLYELHSKQIYAICCRDAQIQFEVALKAWRKHPDSGMYLMLSNHFGARHLANTWQNVIDYFHITTAGPSLEAMIEAVMARGLDPRIQYASSECRRLIGSYINCQSHPDEVVKSWMKFSGALRDDSSIQRYMLYVSEAVPPRDSRQYILDEAQKSYDTYKKYYHELNELFNKQCLEIANSAREFRIGKSLISGLHQQVSRSCMQVLNENFKLQREIIRDNDKLLKQQYKSKDYIEEMSLLSSSDETTETSDIDSETTSDDPPKKTPADEANPTAVNKLQKLLNSNRSDKTAASYSEIDNSSDNCQDDKPESGRNAEMSDQAAAARKPPSSGSLKSKGSPTEPKDEKATTHARQSPGPMGIRSVQTQTDADAGAGETESPKNWDQITQESFKGLDNAEIFRKNVKAAMSKPPPKS